MAGGTGVADIQPMPDSVALADVYRYPTQPRDTLIGLSQRLLAEPGHWRDLQRLEHIRNPRRLRPGTVLRIPYAWLRTSQEQASVQSVSGSVTSAGHPVESGERLAAGSTLQTGADGAVTLKLADGSTVALPTSCSLRLERMMRIDGLGAHDTRLRLESGRVEVSAATQGAFGRFEIITPVATSAVRGTQFRVAYVPGAGPPSIAQSTLDGHVAVAAARREVSVGAGFGTAAQQGEPPIEPVPLLAAPVLTMPERNAEAAVHLTFAPVPGAAAYRIQLARDEGYTQLVSDQRSEDPSLRTAALPEGQYWLRARAIDGHGIEGLEARAHFTQRLPPARPEPRGADGAVVYETDPTLAWSDTGTGAYHLQLARDPQFQSPMADERIGATHWQGRALGAGTYYWRVASIGAQEAGEWSIVRRFEVRVVPAPVVDLGTAHVLAWAWPEQSVPVRLQIARDAQFHSLVFDSPVGPAGTTMHRPWPGRYFARLRADATAASPSGPVTAFEVPVPRWARVALPLALVAPLL